MPNYYSVLTATGQPKVAASLLPGGAPLAIAAMAFGDGGGAAVTPVENREALVREVHRRAVNSVARDTENANWIVVECVLPPDIGGWTVREVGVFDAAGDLVGYGNFPDTYKPVLAEGSGKELIVRLYLEITSAAQVTLQINPSVVNATQAWVAQQIQAQQAQVQTLLDQAFRSRRARRAFIAQI